MQVALRVSSLRACSGSWARSAVQVLPRCRLHASALAAMPVTDVEVESAAHLVSTGQCTYLDVRWDIDCVPVLHF
jgi:hypothetical protein